MSGIVAVVNLQGGPVDRQLIWELTQNLSYRGPDAQEIWINDSIGLGHTLLRTTSDPEHGTAPYSLKSGVWITADARVDGRANLIRELSSHGPSLPENASDSLLILRAYEAWGEECPGHLLGDFAFVIWDTRLRLLFCARDHFGVKPLYYSSAGDCLVISNTLNCVLRHPAVPKCRNELAIADFLLFGCNQEAATTSFQNVLRVPPAHCLIGSQGKLRVKRYWTLPLEGQVRYKQKSEYVTHFQELLNVAVSDRLRRSPVAVQMSGGLDSTSVAATANALLKSPGCSSELRAFTVVYDALIPDQERYYSGLVATALQIPIQYLAGDSYAPFSDWDRPEVRGPEPDDLFNAAVKLDHFQQMSAYSRIALSGYGGDPVLHWSSTYASDLLKNLQLGKLASDIATYFFSHGRIPELGFRTALKRCMGVWRRWQPEYPVWLNPDFEAALDLRTRWKLLTSEPLGTHPVRPMAYESLLQPFWPYLFEKHDPGVTSLPLEIRYPFFDLRLVQYLLAMPPMPWFLNKELLRTAMLGKLPEPVRRRPKTPLAGDLLHVRRSQMGPEWTTELKKSQDLAIYIDNQAFVRAAEEYIKSTRPEPERIPVTRVFSLARWLQNVKSSSTILQEQYSVLGSENAGSTGR